jgi:hypothetical protein
VPATPVKVEVGLDGVVTVPPAPAMMLQEPEPEPGVLPAKLAEVPQITWSGPAFAGVGLVATLTVTGVRVAEVHPEEPVHVSVICPLPILTPCVCVTLEAEGAV